MKTGNHPVAFGSCMPPAIIAAALIAVLPVTFAVRAQELEGQVPAAIHLDPGRDAEHPARMVVLHIPSGGVEINGIAYTAAGRDLHPALILLHGLPGNEKNLDLAQAVRRAGWNVITVNYRGRWGSPGKFSFAGNLEDARAVLAYVRDRDNAATLGIDASRIIIAGHSMGGWVTAWTAAQDDKVAGAILISAANMGVFGRTPQPELVTLLSGLMETLAGVSAESLADELASRADTFDWTGAVAGLARKPLLVLSSDDGFATMSNDLVAAVRRNGGTQLSATHVETDHSWSDQRIRLQTEVITWLGRLHLTDQASAKQ